MNPQVTNCNYGFKTIWENDDEMFARRQPFKTELKTVELMPDVSWYLECDNDETKPGFYIYVESQYKIKYSLEYKVRAFEFTQTQQEQSVGIKKVQLSRIEKSNFAYYVKNGIVTFELQANFSYKNKSDYFKVVESANWGLRLKENNATDFDIVVDKQIIQIHKFMFIPESPVFARLFESDFMEAKENKVLITDFKHEIVQAAVDYCYRQDISDFLEDPKNMMELLRFADKYEFQTLHPKVEAAIFCSISKENVFLFASMADKINAEQLRKACINFLKPLLNTSSSWPKVELAEVDPDFFKDLVIAVLNINNGD